MDKILEDKKRIILEFFETQDQDYWKTLEEITNSTKIDSASVAAIVTSSGDFVRSSYRVKQGEPLYTSRELFRDKAPLVDKVIGAFKNRID
ncbi:hypothetical protein [Spirosoma endophyticum]|uniref:Uncharacterized protein n=1 Tax=Spirosoma endophyticum TaxID=662367 RepID=A0A1I2BAM5_9BACT|nr:hypothetical protein [Spirosoma endophyticum]SFE52948.1 hypothetical protein SAMN05216167_11537 [Spirosoma endophyticum]